MGLTGSAWASTSCGSARSRRSSRSGRRRAPAGRGAGPPAAHLPAGVQPPLLLAVVVPVLAVLFGAPPRRRGDRAPAAGGRPIDQRVPGDGRHDRARPAAGRVPAGAPAHQAGRCRRSPAGTADRAPGGLATARTGAADGTRRTRRAGPVRTGRTRAGPGTAPRRPAPRPTRAGGPAGARQGRSRASGSRTSGSRERTRSDDAPPDSGRRSGRGSTGRDGSRGDRPVRGSGSGSGSASGRSSGDSGRSRRPRPNDPT